MKTIKVRTPAKLNLSLELLNRMDNGYHNISSVMQAINLYDYLTIKSSFADINIIKVSGNSVCIPYDNKNIAYKAAELFLNTAGIKNSNIEIYIEKNIPTEAGLAGGSTNAAGTLLGLNEIFNNIFTKEELHNLAAQLGSDLNFCLEGGACLLSSWGEIIDEKLPFQNINFVVIKPVNISVSTKLCYQNYAALNKPSKTSFYSQQIADLFKNDFSIKKLSKYLYNDLELAISDLYPQLDTFKIILKTNGAIETIMTGSGSAVFGIFDKQTEIVLKNNEVLCYSVKSIPTGVKIL